MTAQTKPHHDIAVLAGPNRESVDGSNVCEAQDQLPLSDRLKYLIPSAAINKSSGSSESESRNNCSLQTATVQTDIRVDSFGTKHKCSQLNWVPDKSRTQSLPSSQQYGINVQSWVRTSLATLWGPFCCAFACDSQLDS